jgi:hypothetical protein
MRFELMMARETSSIKCKLLTWEARIGVLACVASDERRCLLTTGAVLDQRLQASDVSVLVRDVLLELFNQRNQIVDASQQIL